MPNITPEQQDKLSQLVVWYPEYHWFWEIVDLVDEFVEIAEIEWYKKWVKRKQLQEWSTMRTLEIDTEHESHMSILIDILKQLEKVWWASFEETKEEWTTLLMCARENPELFPINK